MDTEKLYGSVDGGNSWVEISSDNIDSENNITWSYDLINGINNIELKVVNSLGVSGETQSYEYNLDVILPTISEFVTTNNDGEYGISSDINITALLNEPVVPDSFVKVKLSTGDEVILQASPNGAILVGTYTVGEDDDIKDLKVVEILEVNLIDFAGNTTTSLDLNDIVNLDENSNLDNITTQSTPIDTTNTINGTSSEDIIKATENTDIIDGGDDEASLNGDLDGSIGADTLSYEDSTESIQVDLRNVGTDTSIGELVTSDGFTKYSTGYAQGDVVKNIENFQCSNNGDQLVLSEQVYFVTGGAGDDTFVAANDGTYRIDAGAGTNKFILSGDVADYTVSSVQGFPQYEQITNGDITVIYKKLDDNNDPISNNFEFDPSLTADNAADKLTASVTNSLLEVSDPSSVSEGSEVVFDVTLSNAKANDTLVNLSIVGIDANDYSSLAYSTDGGTTYVEFTSGNNVNIPEGFTTLKVKVITTDDAEYEANEALTLVANTQDTDILNANENVVGTTILTDEEDGRPVLSIADIIVNEDGTATFTVTLSKSMQKDVTFDYSSHDGTAIAGLDYTAIKGSSQISAGSTTATITVQITDDFIIDNYENMHITLHNISDNVTIQDNTATATITDNSSDTNLNIIETQGGYSITLDQTPSSLLTVDVEYKAMRDGEIISGTKTILVLENTTSKEFTIDGIDEILSINVTNIDGGYLENIIPHPLAPSLEVDKTSENAEEGNVFTFDVNLSFKKASDTEISLEFNLDDEYNNSSRLIDSNDYSSLEYTLDNGSSWIPFTNGDLVTIPANTDGIKVKMVSVADNIKEGDESITLTASTDDVNIANNNTDVVSQEVVLIDKDTLARVSIDNVLVNEVDGYAEFTVSLNSVTQHQVSFDYTTENGTAISGEDFTSVSDTAVIAAGELSTTIKIPITDDFYIENIENFKVLLSNVSNNASITDGEGVATINAEASIFADDITQASESVVSITQVKNYVVEGETTQAYTVSVTNAPTDDLVINFVYTGTAADGTDFTKLLSTTIPKGETSAVFTIATIDDSLKEGNENITISIVNDFAIGQSGLEKIIIDESKSSVTTTIADNDLCILDFISSSNDGTYVKNDIINISVNLDTIVKSGSTMTVTLDTGDQIVLTASEDGTTLVGNYTVGDGDFTGDLSIYSIDDVNITHEFNGEVRLTDKIESLNSNYINIDETKDIVVSLENPVITMVNGAGDNEVETVSIEGTSYANATVEVYGTFTSVVKDENNNDILGTQETQVLLGTVTADSNGNWSFDSTYDVGVYDVVAKCKTTNLEGEVGYSNISNDARIIIGDENYDIYNKTSGDLSSNIEMSGSINYVNAGHNTDAISTGAGIDNIDGGKNFGDIGNELEADSVYYSNSNVGIDVDLRNLNTGNTIDDSGVGHASGDIISNVENIYGSDHNDRFIMSQKAYFVSGGKGDDTFIIAESGTFKISGGEGLDNIILAGSASDYNEPVAIEGSVQGETNYMQITSKDGKVTLIYQVEDENDLLKEISFDSDLILDDATNNANYIDGAVVGMSYVRVDSNDTTNEKGSGKTGTNGDFDFGKDETITFTVGNVNVGTVNTNDISDNLLFLHDIAGIANRDTSNATADQLKYLQNLAVFFQFIDSDNNPYNNIVIKDDMIAKINNTFLSESIDLKTTDYSTLSVWLKTIEGMSNIDVPSLEEAMIHVEDMVTKHTSEIKSFSDLVGTKIIELAPTIHATANGEYENGKYNLNIADGSDVSDSIYLQGSYSQAYMPTITITDQYGKVIQEKIQVVRLVHDNSDTTNRLWEFTADGLADGIYTITITTKDLSSSLEIIAGTGINSDMEKVMNWADDSSDPDQAPTIENYNAIIVPPTITQDNIDTLNALIATYESDDVDTVDEIEDIVKTLDIVQYAHTNGDSTPPELSDFVSNGIDGVDDSNLSDILEAIAATTLDDVSTPAEIQDVVNSAIAQKLIEDYADDSSNETPSVADYIKAGVVGVTADTLAEVNAAVDAVSKDKVDTLDELQGVINDAIDSIAAMDKIVSWSEDSSDPLNKPTSEDYETAKIPGVTNRNIDDLNEAIANSQKDDVDTVSEIKDVIASVDALNIIEDYASDATNKKPTVSDYTTAGVVGVTSDNLDDVNSKVDAKVGEEVDTVPELQEVINTVASVSVIDKIAQYADTDGQSDTPTSTDYTDAGVIIPTGTTVDDVNEVIAKLEKDDVDTLSEIQDVVDSVAALNKIEEYADNSFKDEPILSDYIKAGVIGVTADNLEEVNEAVAAKIGEDVDTIAELQEVINSIPSVNAIDLISQYADTNGTSEEPTEQTYAEASITIPDTVTVDEINERIALLSKDDVDTIPEIEDIISAIEALNKIADYAEDSSNEIPTVADYKTAGIYGVKPDTIDEVNKAIEAATKDDADTVAEVQDIASAANAKVAAFAKIVAYAQDAVQNPSPTLEDYQDVGAIGVTQNNLDAINQAVDDATCTM